METKSTPRDAFLYLLGLITLVASAISFGVLAYQLTDLRFPDALQYISGNYDTIRIALATLIVMFPVFLLTARFLRKDVVANPAKKELKVRRWLMWFTVFVASLVVIADLIALINTFLQGDLTTRFILKVLIILFIAGTSLFYYLAELRDMKYQRKLFAWVIVAVVALTVGYSFWVAGSPQTQRLIRFDNDKVTALSSIQDRLVYYWQQKGSLPTALEQLNDQISGFSVPADPQSNQPFEYRVVNARGFQLCAEFNLPSVDQPASGPYNANNWQHIAGHVCFDRTIDASLYPVNGPKGVPVPVK